MENVMKKTTILSLVGATLLLNEAAKRQKKIIAIGNFPSNTLQLREVAKNLKTT
jgi:hypothetical protein